MADVVVTTQNYSSTRMGSDYTSRIDGILEGSSSVVNTTMDLLDFGLSESVVTPSSHHNLAKYILVGSLLVVFIALAIAGNILVIVAILTDRNLRRTGNYFLVSLAVADTLVALTVMTFAVVNDLDRWHFGPEFCNVWLAADIMCCTASILSLCAVSLDRYINVRKPLHYSRLITHRRCLVTIAVIWIMSALLSFLPIHLGWHKLGLGGSNKDSSNNSTKTAETGNTTLSVNVSSIENATFAGIQKDNPAQCAMELNKYYAVISSSISFYIPCIVMILIYCKLYRFAQMHVKSIRQSQQLYASCAASETKINRSGCEVSITLNDGFPGPAGSSLLSSKKSRRLSDGGSIRCSDKTRLNGSLAPSRSCSFNDRPFIQTPGLMSRLFTDDRSNISVNSTNPGGSGGSPGTRRSSESVFQSSIGCASPIVLPHRKRPSMDAIRSIKVSSDHKAALTVGIIMGVFLICWMPFFAVNIIGRYCEHCIPDIVITIFTWFGYTNSAMNPIIYSVFNHDFRRAFKRILGRCRCWRCRRAPWRSSIGDGFSSSNGGGGGVGGCRGLNGRRSEVNGSLSQPGNTNCCYIQIQTPTPTSTIVR